MKKYYIINNENEYWSRNERFRYWSQFDDMCSIKSRIKYNYIMGNIVLFLMHASDVKAKLIKIKNA